MLKILAIVVGCVVGATRLIGVVAPELMRRMLKAGLERRVVPLAMMVVVAVVGGFLMWGFEEYANARPANWAAYVLLAFGVVMTVMGLLFLAVPRIPFGLMAKLFVARTSTLRALSLLGVAVAVAIVLVAALGL